MKLVVDTNKIVACLLRDGKVRRLLFLPVLEFYTIEYALEEIERHKEYFLRKVSGVFFDVLLKKAEKIIKVVEMKEVRNYVREAKEIAKQFDEKDVPFIALALKLNVPIWTNDKRMIEFGLKTGKYLALDTEAVEELIKGASLDEVRRGLKKRHEF